MWPALCRIVVQGLASIGIYKIFSDDNEVTVQGDYVDNTDDALVNISDKSAITIGVLFIGLLFALYKAYKK